MELVEGDLAPVVGEDVVRVGDAIEPGEGGELFGIEGLPLAQAHVVLVVGLGGEDAAVELEVELILPGGDADLTGGGSGRRLPALADFVVVPLGRVGGDFGLDSGEVVLRGAVAHGGNGELRGGVAGGAGGDVVLGLVEHVAGGTAAVIADAVEVHHVRGAGVALGGLFEVGADAGGVYVVMHVVGGEVGEDL